MPLETFNKLTSEDKKSLVIIDNFVLDFGDFNLMHPGGRFTLDKNIGRDISKFFYGGYSMVPSENAVPYTHSIESLKIAKGMIVGTLEDQDKMPVVETQIGKRNPVNDKDFSFPFVKTSGVASETNFANWYWDLGMIGKHYLVCSAQRQ